MTLFYDKFTAHITPTIKDIDFPRDTSIRYIINNSNVGILLEIDGEEHDMQPGFNEVNIPVSLKTRIKYNQNPTPTISFEFKFFFPY